MLKLSYIIPCHNGEKFISKCLDNVYSQDIGEDEFEIICVNDCSTDNTREVILNYGKNHSNLRVIDHTENKRQGGAKNTGIRVAKGEYIVFIDQDDFINHLKTSELYDCISENALDIAGFRFMIEKSPNNWLEMGSLESRSEIMSGQEFCEKYSKSDVSFAPWSYWYRREYLLQLDRWFAEEVMWEDADWVAQAVFFASKMQFFPIPVYKWAFNGLSISHTVDYRTIADMILMGYRKFIFGIEIEKLSPIFSKQMKTDGVQNSQIVAKVWKLKRKHINLFYNKISITNKTPDFSNSMSGYNKFLFRYPKTVKFFALFLSPLVRSLLFIKNFKKKLT